MTRGFTEISTDERHLQDLIRRIVAGVTVLTDDSRSLHHFPWQVVGSDAYGEKYKFEAGLCGPAEGRRGERKFRFHYCDGVGTRGMGTVSTDAPVEEYRHLFDALAELSNVGRAMTCGVAARMDMANHAHRWYAGSMVERLRGGTFIIRVLRYLERDASIAQLHPADAAAHHDRSAFTSHFWSSHPGLRIYGPDDTEHPIDETGFGDVLIFPGEKFAAIARDPAWAMLHEVRDLRPSGQREGDRFAVIGFHHPLPDARDAAWLRRHITFLERREARFRARQH